MEDYEDLEEDDEIIDHINDNEEQLQHDRVMSDEEVRQVIHIMVEVEVEHEVLDEMLDLEVVQDETDILVLYLVQRHIMVLDEVDVDKVQVHIDQLDYEV